MKVLYPMILAKMREKQISDFSEREISRVFGDCVSSVCCRRGLNRMLADGLRMNDVFQPTPSQSDIQLSLWEA